MDGVGDEARSWLKEIDDEDTDEEEVEKERVEKEEVDKKINANSTMLPRCRSKNYRQQEAPLP